MKGLLACLAALATCLAAVEAGAQQPGAGLKVKRRLAGGHSAAPAEAIIPTGVYVLKNVNSGKYLNVVGGWTNNSANVWIWDNPDAPESQWEIRRVDGASNGTIAYTLENVNSAKYLNVPGENVSFWTNARIWDDANIPGSRWVISLVRDDIYTLKTDAGDMYLNVLGGWEFNGANVHMWDNPYSNHSQWQLVTVVENPPFPEQNVSSSSVRCGIAVNEGNCTPELAYLTSLDPRAKGFHCMGFGGRKDPCALSITNDSPDAGMSKNPADCTRRLFHLWDEPGTQCDAGYDSCGSAWAGTHWKAYVDRWEAELGAARARGMKIASPLMRSGDEAALLKRFSDFFDSCPECRQPGSKYHIDVLAFNAFVQQPISDQMDHLYTLSAALKRDYPDMSVYATNFGALFEHTAAAQADVIANYHMYNRNVSHFDAVYYFAARDYCGLSASECTTNNFLRDTVESGPHQGKTLGQVLIETCFR